MTMEDTVMTETSSSLNYQRERIMSIGMLSFSLLLTILVLITYSFMKELKSIYSWALASLSFCVIIKDLISLDVVTDGHLFSPGYCLFSGYLMQYCDLTCSCWLLAMCIENYLSFGLSKEKFDYKDESTKASSKRFYFYSGLIWLANLLIVVIQHLCGVKPWVPLLIQETIGKDYQSDFCEGTAAVVFYYIPVGIILNCAIVLQMLTFVTCDPIEEKSINKNRIRCQDCNIALLLMTLLYVFEIVSRKIEDTTDFRYMYQTLLYSQGIMFCTVFMKTDIVDRILTHFEK